MKQVLKRSNEVPLEEITEAFVAEDLEEVHSTISDWLVAVSLTAQQDACLLLWRPQQVHSQIPLNSFMVSVAQSSWSKPCTAPLIITWWTVTLAHFILHCLAYEEFCVDLFDRMLPLRCTEVFHSSDSLEGRSKRPLPRWTTIVWEMKITKYDLFWNFNKFVSFSSCWMVVMKTLYLCYFFI